MTAQRATSGDITHRIDRRERTPELGDRLLSVTDILHKDPSLLDLVDLPTVFPKVWGILGWNFYSYHSHLDVTPPASPQTTNWTVVWHQDNMRVNDEIEIHPRPRLSLKVGYYLSDAYDPVDTDVPLRVWLAEHTPDDAAWKNIRGRRLVRPQYSDSNSMYQQGWTRHDPLR